MVNNFLSVDLEEWFNLGFYKVQEEQKNNFISEPFIVRDALKLLQIFKKYGAKATFFVLGVVLEKYPDLIKEVERHGHEIASHGYTHIPIYELSPLLFEDELKRSMDILSKVIRQRVIGYRAPHLSIGKNLWAYELLERNGFVYDSSVKHRPLLPSQRYKQYYKIELINRRTMLEFPVSAFNFFCARIPFSGGTYYRLLPKSIIKRCIEDINKKGDFAQIYLHPRDLAEFLPRLKLSFTNQLRYSGHFGNNLEKIEFLLSNFKFMTIKDYLENNGYIF